MVHLGSAGVDLCPWASREALKRGPMAKRQLRRRASLRRGERRHGRAIAVARKVIAVALKA